MMGEPDVKTPKEGEKTKKQRPGRGGFASMFSQIPGFGKPPAGTFNLYRRMRQNPTIALARAIATAPIRVAEWSLEANDDVPPEQVEFIKKEISSWWGGFIDAAVFGLDYGFQAFEKVWEERDGMWVYRKLKPLVPDATKILENPDTGAFEGLSQGDVKIGADKSFLYTYDGEAGQPHGRSRHENVRMEAWWPWEETNTKVGQYVTKVAGVLPMIKYPVGQSLDASGDEETNEKIAQGILRALGSGEGVTMPLEFAPWAEQFLTQGMDPTLLMAWQIEFMETTKEHGTELINLLKHYESLMMRGWLVPERAGIEGTFGTKAEAGEHGDVAIVIAGLTWAALVRQVNWHLVNPLLAVNFGPETRNTIRMVRRGLDPAQLAFFRELVKSILGAPGNIDLVISWLDVDGILDAVGLPKAAEILDVERADQPDDPNAPMRRILRAIYQPNVKG